MVTDDRVAQPRKSLALDPGRLSRQECRQTEPGEAIRCRPVPDVWSGGRADRVRAAATEGAVTREGRARSDPDDEQYGRSTDFFATTANGRAAARLVPAGRGDGDPDCPGRRGRRGDGPDGSRTA